MGDRVSSSPTLIAVVRIYKSWDEQTRDHSNKKRVSFYHAALGIMPSFLEKGHNLMSLLISLQISVH
jgi:hypothetical protein